MAGRDQVYVDIIAETKKAVTGMATFAAGIAAAIVVAKKLFDLGRDMVKSYGEQELAISKLNAAIKASGRTGEITTSSLTDLATELQRVTTFGDEATVSAAAMVQQLANLDEKGLKQVIPSMQDFAAAMGVDLDTAATLIGKTLGSSTNALSRYGIELDMTLSPTEKLAALTEELDEKFGGMARAMADTSMGAAVQFNNAVGDLKESLGEYIAIGLEPATRKMTHFIERITDAIEESKLLKRVLGGGFDVQEFDETASLLAQATENGKQLEAAFEAINERIRDSGAEDISRDFRDIFLNLGGEIKRLWNNDAISVTNTELEKTRDILIAQMAANNNYVANLKDLAAAQKEVGDATSDSVSDYQLQSAALAKLNTEFAFIDAQAIKHGDAIDVVGEKNKVFSAVISKLEEHGFRPYGNAVVELGIRFASQLTPATVAATEAAFDYGDQIKRNVEIQNEFNEALTPQLSLLEAGADVLYELGDAAKAAEDEQREAAAGTVEAWLGAFRDVGAANERLIRFQKAAALAQIAWNTAVAITEALKIPIYGELKAVAIGIAGVAQAAAVLSQNVPALAEGGIVNRPTLALIGERGPEAVVPLGRGGGMRPIIINIEGSVVSENQLRGFVAQTVAGMGRGY